MIDMQARRDLEVYRQGGFTGQAFTDGTSDAGSTPEPHDLLDSGDTKCMDIVQHFLMNNRSHRTMH